MKNDPTTAKTFVMDPSTPVLRKRKSGVQQWLYKIAEELYDRDGAKKEKADTMQTDKNYRLPMKVRQVLNYFHENGTEQLWKKEFERYQDGKKVQVRLSFVPKKITSDQLTDLIGCEGVGLRQVGDPLEHDLTGIQWFNIKKSLIAKGILDEDLVKKYDATQRQIRLENYIKNRWKIAMIFRYYLTKS